MKRWQAACQLFLEEVVTLFYATIAEGRLRTGGHKEASAILPSKRGVFLFKALQYCTAGNDFSAEKRKQRKVNSNRVNGLPGRPCAEYHDRISYYRRRRPGMLSSAAEARTGSNEIDRPGITAIISTVGHVSDVTGDVSSGMG